MLRPLFALVLLIFAWAQVSQSLKVTFPSNSTTECVACPPGSFGSANCSKSGDAFICDPGQCALGNNCTACAKGQYSDEWNSTSCESCRPGTYSIVGATKCVPCTRGYICIVNSAFNATFIQPCPPGFYCPDEGMAIAYVCPVASYCPDAAMTAPKMCPKGYYCPTTQTTVPIICDAGFYCPSYSSSPLTCSVLLTSNPGADSCYPTAGMYVLIFSSAAIVIGLVAWLWLRNSARVRQREEERISEASSLIPEPEGPKYQGL